MTEVKNINDVLGDERVQDALDENLHFFLRAVFIAKRALNLRHDFAHRGLQPDDYNQVTASMAIMTLIALGAMGSHAAYMAKNEDVDHKPDDGTSTSR